MTCETFIPGFTGDLYGTDPVVEFHAYLSPSKKFDTLDELRGCDAHFSVILSEEDTKLYNRLGIHVSCEPKYEIKKLYHK